MSNRTTIKKFFSVSILSVLTLFTAGPAFGLIEGELSVGSRQGKFSSKSLTGTSLELAGHLDPIPLVPVSFGVRVINDTYNPKVADHGYKSLSSTALVPEVSAWIPLLGDIKPFARLGYTLVSAYKGTKEATVGNTTIAGDVGYKSSGMRAAAGVSYNFMPFVYLSAAFEQSSEKLTVSDKLAGIVLEDMDFSNTAILVGIKAGL